MPARRVNPLRLEDGDSVPIPTFVLDLAMTIPPTIAAALGIWFVTTTVILLAETGLSRRIAKIRLSNMRRVLRITRIRSTLTDRSNSP